MYIVYTFDRFEIYRVETYSYAYAITRTSVNGIEVMRNDEMRKTNAYKSSDCVKTYPCDDDHLLSRDCRSAPPKNKINK